MTMDFSVKDSQQLVQLKVNDAVEFDLKADTQEDYVIVHIKKSTGMKGATP
jgi:Cu/Ag efflux protein CusF